MKERMSQQVALTCMNANAQTELHIRHVWNDKIRRRRHDIEGQTRYLDHVTPPVARWDTTGDHVDGGDRFDLVDVEALDSLVHEAVDLVQHGH